MYVMYIKYPSFHSHGVWCFFWFPVQTPIIFLYSFNRCILV